jgi:hypothetical protein
MMRVPAEMKSEHPRLRKPGRGAAGGPLFVLLLALLLFGGNRVEGHTASAGYLELKASSDRLQTDLALSIRDVDDLLGLDANADGFVVWSEVQARETDLFRYVAEHLRIQAGASPWNAGAPTLVADRKPEGGYAVVRMEGPRPPPGILTVDYTVFAERDPMHRTLAKYVDEGGIQTAVLGTLSPQARFASGMPVHDLSFFGFVREGIHHIWTGYDHLSFLFALLLPAVLIRSPDGWIPARGFRPVFFGIVRIVTAFTAAHSVTLALAAFEVLRLPSRWVESAIAASIVFAVGTNFLSRTDLGSLRPGIRRLFRGLCRYPAGVAFAFGWIHGFGFAGVLGEFGLGRGDLAKPLIAFNLGVEIGQMACVVIFLPIAYPLRGSAFYRRGVLPIGSGLIALLAAGWLVDRVGNLGFMPF